jgi:hypothetical protein
MLFLKDNGGGRLGADRRCDTCLIEMSERRSGKERRCGDDRRKPQKPKRKWIKERRMSLRVLSSGKFLYNS